MVAFALFTAIINYTWLLPDTITVSRSCEKANDGHIVVCQWYNDTIPYCSRCIEWLVNPQKAGARLCRSKVEKYQKHSHVCNSRGSSWWSGKIQAWVGPCFARVTFWSDSPPLCHLIPLEGTQNEVERGKSGREKKSLKGGVRKRKSTTDAEIKRERVGEEDWSILMRNNKWPPWPSSLSPSLSTSLTFEFGNWFTVAAVDGGILKMVTPHLINIATCTENMSPWSPAKWISTMLFTNQYWRCTGEVIKVSCG